MALPNGYNIKEYLPTEQDFADVFAAKQNGNIDRLPWYPLGKDEPYYYPTIRIYLAAILLKWEEFGKRIEESLLGGKYEYINGIKTLVPYYTTKDLAIIRSFAIQYKQYYISNYMKYKDAGQGIESPEKLRQAARDARKGEIEVKLKNNGNLIHIIAYDMNYGDVNPNKKQSGYQRRLFFGKNIGDKYNIVVRGGSSFGSDKNRITDAPYFKTEQEARNFIANINHSNINTRVAIEDWRYVITDAHIDNGWAYDSNGDPIKDWYNPTVNDAILVQTTCGPAYMLKLCDLLKKKKESLEEKDMNEAIEDYKDELGYSSFNRLDNKVELIFTDSEKAEATYEKLKKLANCEVRLRSGRAPNETIVLYWKKDLTEAVEKHETLNPKLFENNKLKPEVRQKAQDVINEFLKILAEEEVKINIRDVILTGSNASYNYTKDSDVDLHVIAETKSLDEQADIYAKLYRAYGRIFGKKFEISFYGIPVEIYVETEADPVVSNGIYSVMYDQWIKEPSAVAIPEIDQKAIDKASKPWIDEAKALVKEVDDNVADGEEKIDDYITRLYELRQKGIYSSAGNEYSTENLIFKEVRNAGLLDKLKKLKNVIISKKLSLEEAVGYLDDKHEFKDYGTAEVEGGNVIDTSRASTFATQDLLDHKEDAAYDGIVYDIVDLTPTQYFELCGKVQDIDPETLMDYIKTDERQLAHIKDVILKYNKRLQMPFVSFSKMDEVSGQEGRHRMYALGEMYGWDKEFPVMVIQDLGAKKTIGELLHESIMEDFCLPEKDRRDYIAKISQLTHYQPIIQQNGLFHLHNVKENDREFVLAILRKQNWVEYVNATWEKYDFSDMKYLTMPTNSLPSRYSTITGKIKI